MLPFPVESLESLTTPFTFIHIRTLECQAYAIQNQSMRLVTYLIKVFNILPHFRFPIPIIFSFVNSNYP